MRKTLFLLVIAAFAVGTATAQNSKRATSDVSGSQMTSANGSIAAGTQVSGQLQSTLNADKARVGDQVLLKTTKTVKQNGQTVVEKGSTLVGRVTEVASKTKQNSTSRIGVVFDRLRQDGGEVQITSMVTSIINANANNGMISAEDDMQFGSTTSARSSRQASSGGGVLGGGVLGGVTNTVGGVVNTTTQTVGGVTNTAGQTVGGVANTATGSIRGLSIAQSANASAQGGSVLSLDGKNLKLDKGTTFNLAITGSTSMQNR